jgi:quercetin dioxygenase-like cupin family protein
MTTVDLNALELTEFTGIDDPKQHCRATFPLLGAHGTKHSATVYFELEPGRNLGRHTDSAEELLLILEGSVEVTVGEEKTLAAQGQIVLVPVMEPHDLRNIGQGKARVLGFFGGANHIVATFDQTWLPTHSNTVDTAAAFGN